MYRSQAVFPAGLALALLYLTVMHFVSPEAFSPLAAPSGQAAHACQHSRAILWPCLPSDHAMLGICLICTVLCLHQQANMIAEHLCRPGASYDGIPEPEGYA